jgi:hypothetical protein
MGNGGMTARIIPKIIELGRRKKKQKESSVLNINSCIFTKQ